MFCPRCGAPANGEECETCGAKLVSGPLHHLEAILTSNPANEPDAVRKAAAHVLQGVVFLSGIALCALVFGVGAWGFSVVYAAVLKFVYNHPIVVAVPLVALFAIGMLNRKRADTHST
ncbi:MAG: hypothetical protein ACR2IF_08735 [Terriglobales bacterium]